MPTQNYNVCLVGGTRTEKKAERLALDYRCSYTETLLVSLQYWSRSVYIEKMHVRFLHDNSDIRIWHGFSRLRKRWYRFGCCELLPASVHSASSTLTTTMHALQVRNPSRRAQLIAHLIQATLLESTRVPQSSSCSTLPCLVSSRLIRECAGSEGEQV